MTRSADIRGQVALVTEVQARWVVSCPYQALVLWVTACLSSRIAE